MSLPGHISRLCVSIYPHTGTTNLVFCNGFTVDHVTIGVYGFLFNRDSSWVCSIVDDLLYLKVDDAEKAQYDTIPALQVALRGNGRDMNDVYQWLFQTGSAALYFSQNQDPDETWLPLLEKAYAKVHCGYDALCWRYIKCDRSRIKYSWDNANSPLVKRSKTLPVVCRLKCIREIS